MLKEKLLEDLKNSMKEKNIVRKNVIQMVRAAILQKEKDNNIELDDTQIMEIISKEHKKREEMRIQSTFGNMINSMDILSIPQKTSCDQK